ncbi:DUF1471 domain-containing protein [Yersinia enterocolitica]
MKKSMFLLLLMTYVTYSISAVEVSKTQAHSLHEMGHISVHGDPTVLSPEAAKNALNKKADKLGAGYYYIVAMGTAGDSSEYNADAIIYN